MGDDSERTDAGANRPRIENSEIVLDARPVDAAPSDEKKLLELYKSLRAEIRTHIRVANRRGMQGLLVLGGIVATAVSQENFYVLAFVPIVSGLFLANAIISRNEMLTIAYHLCSIEEELSEENSEFRYEQTHGAGFGKKRARLFSGPDAESFPNYTRMFLYAVAYFIFGWILWGYWETPYRLFPDSYGPESPVPFLKIPPSPVSESRTIVIGEGRVFGLLVLLSLVLGAVLLLHLCYRRELRAKFDDQYQ